MIAKTTEILAAELELAERELAAELERREKEREECEQSFLAFARCAWPHVVPGEQYRHGRHIDVMVDHLEGVRLGQIPGLIINVPPGHSKSVLCSILWPAWLWIQNPHWRFITATYAAGLSTRDAIKMRELVTSDWYQGHWGKRVAIDPVRDTQVDFWTTQRGQRFSTSTGGTLTGQHAHVQLIDDPLNAVDASSAASRTRANEWLSQALSSRWVPGNPTRFVLIMQRLHEEDPTGYLLKQGGYEHLCLRAEYEPGIYSTSRGEYEWRQEPGEILWPELYPRARIDALKRALGSYGTAGQLQQRPAPAEGGLLKRANWQRFDPRYPPKFDKVIQSWDLRFKRTTSEQDRKGPRGDYVVGVVLGKAGANIYLLDVVRGLWGFGDSKAELLKLSAKWPQAYAKLVENKANGPALVDDLGGQVQGLKLVEPQGDKLQRVEAIAPLHEAFNLYLPSDAPWLAAFEDECASFPNGAHDDQLDAYTQGVIYLRDTATARLKALAGMKS
jgi:predicted phage terminase large subunit-like protein